MSNWTIDGIMQDARSGSIQVQGTLGTQPLAVQMEPDAIVNRMEFYGLSTCTEALDAILREHSVRIGEASPLTGTIQEMAGGLDSAVAIAWSVDAAAQRDALLPALRDR